MKIMMPIAAIGALLTLDLAGCGKSPEKTFEAAMKMNEQIANLAEANKDDCGKMATAVVSLFEKNKDLIKRAKEMKSTLKPEEIKTMTSKYAARAKAYLPKMANLGKCMGKSKKLREAIMAVK